VPEIQPDEETPVSQTREVTAPREREVTAPKEINIPTPRARDTSTPRQQDTSTPWQRDFPAAKPRPASVPKSRPAPNATAHRVSFGTPRVATPPLVTRQTDAHAESRRKHTVREGKVVLLGRELQVRDLT